MVGVLPRRRKGGRILPLAGSCQESIDQGPGHASRRRDVWQILPGKPAQMVDLDPVRPRLARKPAGFEAEHQGVGKGPGLGLYVSRLLHFDARLLHHLSPQGFLERFSKFDESGDEAMPAGGELGIVGEENFVAPRHEDDHRRGDAGKEGSPAA